MTALFLALALAQAAPPPPTSPAEPPAPTPVEIARSLALTYDQGCGGRIYGMYAEACNNLAAQLKKAQAAARRWEREHPDGK